MQNCDNGLNLQQITLCSVLKKITQVLQIFTQALWHFICLGIEWTLLVKSNISKLQTKIIYIFLSLILLVQSPWFWSLWNEDFLFDYYDGESDDDADDDDDNNTTNKDNHEDNLKDS